MAGDQAGTGAGGWEVRLLGPFALLRHGAPVADREIGSRKARTLLKRLLVERDRVVSTDALVGAVWPEGPPDHPDRQVATLVSRLRAALSSQVIDRTGEGYRFGTGPAYRIDLDEAGLLTAEAEARLAAGEPALAHSAAGRALELFARGELLADEPYQDWVGPARTAAGVLLHRARRCAWSAALVVRDLDRAVRVAEAAQAAEPYDEQACRALMRAHHGRGETGRALAAYERLRATLADELGADPAAETRSLHRSILRDEPAPPVPHPPAPGVLRPGAAGFVGREPELAFLHQAWSRATAGTGGLVLLVGEAGIGKTTLAAEMERLAGATGGQVARARCYEAERSLFLQPVADALRSVVVSASPELVRAAAGPGAGSLAELVGEVGELLGPLGYRRAGPDVERRRVFESVAGFLRALADRYPVLLFLDDLHLAGSSTMEFLHFLVRRIARRPVLVLATVRAEECGEVVDVLGDLAEQWQLGPLSAAEVGELARRSGMAELAGPLMARTRGHSLYVVESLRALADPPIDGIAAGVPDSLRDAVVARLRRAGSEVEELLRAAATIGAGIDPAVVAALLDWSVAQTARRLDAACRARLVSEAGPAYEFANDLIREIAYETTPLPIRIARHRHAAALLVDRPEAVAGHAFRAGDWPAAVEACLQAAEAAIRRYANREAERLLDQAFTAATRAGDPVGAARVRLARGGVREVLADYQGGYEDHLAVLEPARTHGRPDLELAALNRLGGDLLVGVGRPTRECIPFLESALTLAESTADLPTQVDILARLAVIWTNRLRFDVARGYAEQSEALAGLCPDETVRALALDAVKTTLAYRGDVAGLAELLPRLSASLRGYRQSRHRYRQPQLESWAVFESAFPALARGEWPLATARLEQALTIARESGYVAYQSPFLAHLAWVARAQGRYGESLRLGRLAMANAEESGHLWWTALAGTMLGWTFTELGAADDAVSWLERGLAAAERDATEGYLVRCLGHLAWASALRGDHDRARALAGRCEARLDEVTGGAFLHGAHAVLAVAETRLALDEPVVAGRLLPPIRAAASESGWVETVAWADLLHARCRLAAGDPARAVPLAAAARELAEQVPLPGLARRADRLLAELGGDGTG
jgi:DNA-binding SARP family transcriptional activator